MPNQLENGRPTGASLIQSQNKELLPARLFHALVRGSLGFALVSLAAFSVWAFAGKWLQTNLGEVGLYSACALVFLGASGLLLGPLVTKPNSLGRFYTVFIPAFLAYAFVWCTVWFALHFGLGEWLASLLGTSAFAAVMAWRLRKSSGLLTIILVLFAAHTAGYFLGSQSMRWLTGPTGSAVFASFSKHQIGVMAKLSWGLLYGLGFGAGIGYAFHGFQCPSAGSTTPQDFKVPLKTP